MSKKLTEKELCSWFLQEAFKQTDFFYNVDWLQEVLYIAGAILGTWKDIDLAKESFWPMYLQKSPEGQQVLSHVTLSED